MTFERVVRVEGQGSQLGISGVPFFIVDGSWAVSGAQSTEQWAIALRQKLDLRKRSDPVA